MGYKLSAYFYSPSGNCELYYLKGFRSGKPILVGREKAKTYKTSKGAWIAHCKWRSYYDTNRIKVDGDFHIDEAI